MTPRFSRALLLAALALTAIYLVFDAPLGGAAPAPAGGTAAARAAAAVARRGAAAPRWTRALLYAYHENAECATNFAFLMAHGRWDLWNASTLFVVVVNGFDASIAVPDHPSFVMLRRENAGLDFGAHAAGLARVAEAAAAAGSPPPDEYGFLNCGMTGPFLPAYATDADWFGAFSARLSPAVRLVGAYLTCLPPTDLGGPGPRIEGHSFFTDRAGVELLVAAGVLRAHADKLDAIVNGEWGLARAVFAAGGTIDTLLYRYQGVDWRAPENAACNEQLFVGRAGGYGGGDVNPFETIFFKRLWRTLDAPDRSVRWAETARLMAWRDGWAAGAGGRSARPVIPKEPPYKRGSAETDVAAIFEKPHVRRVPAPAAPADDAYDEPEAKA